ncbi:MAG TPA: hypothetical protein VGN34_28515 [Ktedonobacteraceae bacterium]|jgi:hypothetical protein|nr:hypothetical protein [Ktedonobacteraceae bacterium]
MAVSEVALIRKQIELEYEAARRWPTDYAIVARHIFISARLNRIAEYHTLLVELVGDQEAINIVFEAQTKILG